MCRPHLVCDHAGVIIQQIHDEVLRVEQITVRVPKIGKVRDAASASDENVQHEGVKTARCG